MDIVNRLLSWELALTDEDADEIKRLREILCPELAFDDLKLIKGNWLAPKRDFKAVIEARLTALKEEK